jgi:hypothetical protein
MKPVDYIVLKDGSGALWRVAIANTGQINATPLTAGQSGTYSLIDTPGNSVYWRINIDVNGRVYCTQGPATQPLLGAILFRSPNGHYFELRVLVDGRLYTVVAAYNDTPVADGCGLSYALRDSFGRGWKMDLDPTLQIRLTYISDNYGQTLVLRANDDAPVAYRIDVSLAGMLQVWSATYNESLPKEIGLSGGVSQRCNLIVDASGLLYTVFVGQTPQPVIGQLLPQEEGYPPAFQPGGTGTPVIMPAQTVGEKRGRWFLGCGHSVNAMDIRFQSVACTPSALLCCPYCLYLQRIVTPASDIYNNLTNPIIMP